MKYKNVDREFYNSLKRAQQYKSGIQIASGAGVDPGTIYNILNRKNTRITRLVYDKIHRHLGGIPVATVVEIKPEETSVKSTRLAAITKRYAHQILEGLELEEIVAFIDKHDLDK